jgi:glycosyltransferase involved in cell wall biosynthesis
MKIAYLSTFPPFRGGIAQFNAALYRTLEKENEIKAYNFSRQYPDILFPGSSQYVTKEDKVDNIPNDQVLDTINPISYFTAAKKIYHFAPELMLMKFWMPFFAPSLGTVSYLTKKKTKIISVLDNVIPHEKRLGDKTLINYFLNQNHGFIVMSDTVKNDLLSLKPDAKYIYHPHPLYNHFGAKIEQKTAREKLGISADKKIILFFGFIRGYKGLDLLIEAMQNTPDDYLLLIAGEVYGDFKPYQEQIDKLNLNHKIKTEVRYINDSEVPTLFSAANVCVLPYKSATQSGITSIAYHFNTPVIATDVGGLKETVIDNETGLIINNPNNNEIREAINKYFDNNLEAQFQSNIERLKQELSWEHLAHEIITFSNQLSII